MTSTAKLIVGVVVVLVLLGLAYWFWGMPQAGQNPATPYSNQATSQNDSTSLPSGSNTSDASLNQDMGSINSDIQSSSAEQGQVDQSVNAQASGNTGY